MRRGLYGLPKFVLGSHRQQFHCFLAIAAIDGNRGADGWQPVGLKNATKRLCSRRFEIERVDFLRSHVTQQ